MARPSQLLVLFASILTLGRAHPGHARSLEAAAKQVPIGEPALTINGIPPTTRSYWMRQATLALDTPCPFAAFGAVVVNHTANAGLGQLVCSGTNSNSKTGNPIMHGEMAAITNCSITLTDPAGPYKLSPAQALAALADLSLYTNAESCPMCASAIRWAGFKEYIYGTSIDTLIEKGWGQIRISSLDVVAQSFDLPKPTRLLGEILTNETDPYFSWQFDPSYSCPKGCKRVSGTCKAA